VILNLERVDLGLGFWLLFANEKSNWQRSRQSGHYRLSNKNKKPLKKVVSGA